MSDKQIITKEYTISDEAWWWVSAWVLELLDIPDRKVIVPERADGIRIVGKVPGRTIEITAKEGTTYITTTTTAEYPDFWKKTIADVLTLAHNAGRIRRAAVGVQLREVINEYYQRKERGERVKLKDLGDAAGVKYHSLRQAKFRYDEQRRKM